MEYRVLCNGIRMPAMGYGVYRVDEVDCERLVSEAIETGYRLIDTATAYHNEAAVGRALRASRIPREELFVTTKVIRCGSEALTRMEFERSLEALGLDYVDLYLIHQPYGDIYATWRALEDLYAEGRVRAIGVCNFTSARLADLSVNNRIAPMLNQVQIDPYMQRSGELDYMQRSEIIAQAWGPLSQGNPRLYSASALRDIAKNHDKSVAQIALRWHVQRGEAVVAKTANRSRMAENLNIFDFELNSEEMAQIAAMDEGTASDPHDDPAFVKAICGKWELLRSEQMLLEGQE